MVLGVWGAFDLGMLLCHIFGILFVAGFIWAMDYAFLEVASMRAELVGRLIMAVAGTGLIYAFMFDSNLLPVFDTKGIVLILFGGYTLFNIVEKWVISRS